MFFIQVSNFKHDFSWVSDVLGLIVALLGLIVAYAAISSANKQSDRAFYSNWVSGVFAWASRTSEILIKMKLNIERNYGLDDRQAELIELSSCIEQGRLLFENRNKDAWGTQKPYAYQGYRPSILDELVAAYNAYLAFGSSESHTSENFTSFLENRRRLYLSEIQQIIEPEWFFKKAIRFKETEDAPN